MSVSRHLTVLFAALAVLASPPELAAGPRSHTRTDLERGSLITFRLRGQPVSRALELVESLSGNRIRLVDQYDSDATTLLSRKTSLRFSKTPFWNVVEELKKFTGTRFGRLDGHALSLATRLGVRRRWKSAGEPVTAGAFQVIPAVNTRRRQLELRIRPEPWIGTPGILDYRVDLALAGGQRISCRPDALAGPYAASGELQLEVNPSLPKGVRVAEEATLHLRLDIPLSWREKTLPPLSRMSPRSARVGRGSVRVLRVGEGYGTTLERRALLVEIATEGVPITERGISLLAGDGERVEASGWSTSGTPERRRYELEFDPAAVRGDVKDYRLALDVVTLKSRTLGELDALVGQSVQLGKTELRFVKAGAAPGAAVGRESVIEVQVEARGTALPENRIVLLDSRGRRVAPASSYRQRSGDAWRYRLRYDSSGLRGPVNAIRLAADVPEKPRQETVSAFTSLQGKPTLAGEASVRLLRADLVERFQGDQFTVQFEVEGFAVPIESVALLDGRRRLVRPATRELDPCDRGQRITLTFSPGEIDGDPRQARLVLEAPIRTTEYDLRARLGKLRFP